MSCKYKILTPNGWKPFDGLRKITNKEVLEINLENSMSIKCTLNQILYLKDGTSILAQDTKIGNELKIKDGFSKIVNIKNIGFQDVYDILEVQGEHNYYANDVLVHNCEFIGRSNSLIDTQVIRNMLLELENVTYKFVIDGDVRFYQDINPWKKYILTIDTSMGVDGDFCAIQLFAFPGFIQVAEWQSDKTNQNLQVEKVNTIVEWLYANIKEKGNKHPEIYWSLENNGSGEGFICALREKSDDDTNYIKHAKLINEIGNKRIGFTTSKSTKPAACSQLKILIESNQMKIFSREYAVQLSNFSAKSALSYSANGDGHDDLVSSSLVMMMVYLQEKNRLDLNMEVFNSPLMKNEYKPNLDIPIIFSIG